MMHLKDDVIIDNQKLLSRVRYAQSSLVRKKAATYCLVNTMRL